MKDLFKDTIGCWKSINDVARIRPYQSELSIIYFSQHGGADPWLATENSNSTDDSVGYYHNLAVDYMTG